ncbi:hypothetical protein D3C84_1302910 [compost metagenome]
MRQQLINFTRPLRRQARKDILQIHVRIMPIREPGLKREATIRSCLLFDIPQPELQILR